MTKEINVKKESKLQEMFRDDNPKMSAILYFLAAVVWSLCAVMSYHSVVTYDTGRTSLYVDGFLALFNLGLAFGKALKYSRLRKNNALREGTNINDTTPTSRITRRRCFAL